MKLAEVKIPPKLAKRFEKVEIWSANDTNRLMDSYAVRILNFRILEEATSLSDEIDF